MVIKINNVLSYFLKFEKKAKKKKYYRYFTYIILLTVLFVIHIYFDKINCFKILNTRYFFRIILK